MRAEHSICMADGDLAVREIRPGDAENLYRWRMHPSSRFMFRNTDLVPYEDHERFLRRYFESRGRDRWFLIEVSGEPVGAMALYNFTADGTECECGRGVVAPEQRRRGYALRAMRLLLAYARQTGVRRVRAQVDARNSASLRLARAAGFRDSGSHIYNGRGFVDLVASLENGG